MKHVELKTVPMTVLGQTQDFSYKDMLQVVMESPIDPERGAGIEEVRKSIRVLDVLVASKDEMDLEDEDYSYMMSKVRATRFTSANVVFTDFVDYLEKVGKEGD